MLQDRWVLAVAGTHGKTTTSSMLAWMLEARRHGAGFLIGGVPQNFAVSARLGGSRSSSSRPTNTTARSSTSARKFVHYRPRTAILNNLEFDHADIFPDLAAIQRQFHHLVRTIPGDGLIIHPATEQAMERVLAHGLLDAGADHRRGRRLAGAPAGRGRLALRGAVPAASRRAR